MKNPFKLIVFMGVKIFCADIFLDFIIHRCSDGKFWYLIIFCHFSARAVHNISALYFMGWPEDNLINYEDSWIGWSYHKDNLIIENDHLN